MRDYHNHRLSEFCLENQIPLIRYLLEASERIFRRRACIRTKLGRRTSPRPSFKN